MAGLTLRFSRFISVTVVESVGTSAISRSCRVTLDRASHDAMDQQNGDTILHSSDPFGKIEYPGLQPHSQFRSRAQVRLSYATCHSNHPPGGTLYWRPARLVVRGPHPVRFSSPHSSRQWDRAIPELAPHAHPRRGMGAPTPSALWRWLPSGLGQRRAATMTRADQYPAGGQAEAKSNLSSTTAKHALLFNLSPTTFREFRRQGEREGPPHGDGVCARLRPRAGAARADARVFRGWVVIGVTSGNGRSGRPGHGAAGWNSPKTSILACLPEE